MLKATKFVQNIFENMEIKDCIAIDATMGNGNDTLFLSKLVGTRGKVYSFDIQESALLNTRKLLEDNNINYNNNVNLILDSHSNINNYVKDEIHIGMFNLGYLPGGDHGVITKPETTIKALEYIINLLKKGGLVSLIIYYGHDGGEQEKNSILSYAHNLDVNKYRVLKCDYINQGNDPPIVMFIERK